MTEAVRPGGEAGGRERGALAPFLDELAGAFRRLRPQGTRGWNFSEAFGRLHAALERLEEALQPPPAETASAEGARPGGPAMLERARSRLRPLLEGPPPPTPPWEDERWQAVAEGLDATREALRFLAARVEVMEGPFERRQHPMDGQEWLAVPASLAQWAGPLGAWFGDHPAPGVVLHGECGAGELALALSAGGAPVEGVEPRGALAWAAVDAGLRVHPSALHEHLGSLEPEALGAVVLSGVVDRIALEDVLELVELVTSRVAPGGSLVVIGTDPAAPPVGAPAGDVFPGGPRHPDTWLLLLERAGYHPVRQLGPAPEGPDEVPTFAVGGRRE